MGYVGGLACKVCLAQSIEEEQKDEWRDEGLGKSRRPPSDVQDQVSAK